MRKSQEQLRELNAQLEKVFNNWKENPSIENRNEIIDLSDELVNIVIVPFQQQNSTIDNEDLRQEGFLGLITSLESIAKNGYEEGQLYKKMLAYIRKRVLEVIDRSDSIRLQPSFFRTFYALKKFLKDFDLKHGRNPTKEEVFNLSNISSRSLKTVGIYYDVTNGERWPKLFAPIFSENSIPQTLNQLNLDSDDNHDISVEMKTPVSELSEIERVSTVRDFINTLSNIDKQIITSLYGIDKENSSSAQQVAKEMKTNIQFILKTKERVESKMRFSLRNC